MSVREPGTWSEQGEQKLPGATTYDQAKEKTGEAVDQAKAKTGEVVDQAKQAAGSVVDQAKQTATSQVSERKDMAADGLGTVADTLRQASETMRGEQNIGPLVGVAAAAADRVESLSGYLRDTDVNDLVRDVENFARRQPLLFLSGAFALGLLGARFLKSSTPQPDWDDDRLPYERSYGAQGMYGNRSYGSSYPGQGQPSRYDETRPSTSRNWSSAQSYRPGGVEE
jgi:predicted amidohydrolase YtcJ